VCSTCLDALVVQWEIQPLCNNII